MRKMASGLAGRHGLQRPSLVGKRGGENEGVKAGEGIEMAGQVGDLESEEEPDAISLDYNLDRAAPD